MVLQTNPTPTPSLCNNAASLLVEEISQEVFAEASLICKSGGYGTITIEVKDGHVEFVKLNIVRMPKRRKASHLSS